MSRGISNSRKYAPVIPITAIPGATLSIDVGDAAALTSAKNADQSVALTSCVAKGCGSVSDDGGYTGNPCSRCSLALSRAQGGNGMRLSPFGTGRSIEDEIGSLGGFAYATGAFTPFVDPMGLGGRWSMLNERE